MQGVCVRPILGDPCAYLISFAAGPFDEALHALSRSEAAAVVSTVGTFCRHRSDGDRGASLAHPACGHQQRNLRHRVCPRSATRSRLQRVAPSSAHPATGCSRSRAWSCSCARVDRPPHTYESKQCRQWPPRPVVWAPHSPERSSTGSVPAGAGARQPFREGQSREADHPRRLCAVDRLVPERRSLGGLACERRARCGVGIQR